MAALAVVSSVLVIIVIPGYDCRGVVCWRDFPEKIPRTPTPDEPLFFVAKQMKMTLDLMPETKIRLDNMGRITGVRSHSACMRRSLEHAT